MSAPYRSDSLEDQLSRLKALLTVVEHVLDSRTGFDDVDLRSGGEICLEQALDVLDRIQVGLPVKVLSTKIVDQGGAR